MKSLSKSLNESILGADFDEDYLDMVLFEEQLKDPKYWDSHTIRLGMDKYGWGLETKIEGDTLYIKGIGTEALTVHTYAEGFVSPISVGIRKIITDTSINIHTSENHKDGELHGDEFAEYVESTKKGIGISAANITNIKLKSKMRITVGSAGAELFTLNKAELESNRSIVFKGPIKTNNSKIVGDVFIKTDRFGDEGGWRNSSGCLDNIIQFKPNYTLSCGKKPKRKGAAGLIAVILNYKRYPILKEEIINQVECPIDVEKVLGLKPLKLDRFTLANGRFRCTFHKKEQKYTYYPGATTRLYQVPLSGPMEGWTVDIFGNNAQKDNDLKFSIHE